MYFGDNESIERTSIIKRSLMGFKALVCLVTLFLRSRVDSAEILKLYMPINAEQAEAAISKTRSPLLSDAFLRSVIANAANVGMQHQARATRCQLVPEPAEAKMGISNIHTVAQEMHAPHFECVATDHTDINATTMGIERPSHPHWRNKKLVEIAIRPGTSSV